MKNKAPAYQHYPDKWLADTRRLSFFAKGVYCDLLNIIWMQFQDTCSIPDDDAFIASEIGCTIKEWQRAKKEIQNEFRPLLEAKESRLISNGLLKESVKQTNRRQKLSENGRKGGRPKKQLVSGEKAIDNQKKSLSSPTPTVVKDIYGEFANVKLSPEEYGKLLEKHGVNKLKAGIEKLSAYIASSGKKYKSHYAVFCQAWVWEKLEYKRGNGKVEVAY